MFEIWFLPSLVGFYPLSTGLTPGARPYIAHLKSIVLLVQLMEVLCQALLVKARLIRYSMCKTGLA